MRLPRFAPPCPPFGGFWRRAHESAPVARGVRIPLASSPVRLCSARFSRFVRALLARRRAAARPRRHGAVGAQGLAPDGRHDAELPRHRHHPRLRRTARRAPARPHRRGGHRGRRRGHPAPGPAGPPLDQPREIPGNGVDDDGNGFVDDVHGWNFLGGPDGRSVNYETYETHPRVRPPARPLRHPHPRAGAAGRARRLRPLPDAPARGRPEARGGPPASSRSSNRSSPPPSRPSPPSASRPDATR